MSWYRLYRPTSLAGLHQTAVRTQLQEIFASGHFPHALLFTGPKGTGKTSAARIVGAMLNDEANLKATTTWEAPDITNELTQRILRGQSYVVQELDAASNRGIDDVRALKERVQLPPTEGRTSVYILDEVHMLTTEAFNALLKLLEEPPSHVVFILATTEQHKLPATVVSRCTVVRFAQASPTEIMAALHGILEAEKISVEGAVLEQIVAQAGGSFRDAVKLLEQVAAGKTQVTLASAAGFLAANYQQDVTALVRLILSKDVAAVPTFFAQLRDRGVEPSAYWAQLLTYLHQELEKSILAPPEAALTTKAGLYLLQNVQTISLAQDHIIPFLALELKILEMLLKLQGKQSEVGGNTPGKTEPTRTARSTGKVTNTAAADLQATPVTDRLTEVFVQHVAAHPSTPDIVPSAVSPAPSSPTQNVSGSTVGPTVNGHVLLEKWATFLEQVALKNGTLAALLRSAKPQLGEAGELQVEVFYQFHREQLEQPKFRSMLDECVRGLVGSLVQISFRLASAAQPGAALSNVSGNVQEEDHLIQLAKEILV